MTGGLGPFPLAAAIPRSRLRFLVSDLDIRWRRPRTRATLSVRSDSNWVCLRLAEIYLEPPGGEPDRFPPPSVSLTTRYRR